MDDQFDDWVTGMSTTTSKGTAGQQTYEAESYVDAVEDEHYDDDENDEDEDEEYDDYYNDHDNKNGDDAKTELACPFCSEDFDVLSFCCHIDLEHYKEANAAICPVCITVVETNMVVHLITEHETILKILCKKKLRKGGSRSALSILKMEFKDKQLDSSLKGSSSLATSSNLETDPLILSFVHKPIPSREAEIGSTSSAASTLSSNSSYHDNLERDSKTSVLPNKDQERVQRCEFLHGVLFSTIFHDDL